MATDQDVRAEAMQLFNRCWELMEQLDRSPAETEEMIAAARESRALWAQVGTGKEASVGEWQISRAYRVAGKATEAGHHAEQSLALAREHGLTDFYHAAAHEAMGWAHHLAGRAEQARQSLGEAKDLLKKLEDPEEIEILAADLAALEADLG